MADTPVRALSIIGTGAFGTALSEVYRRAGLSVTLMGRDFPRDPKGGALLLAVPTRSVPSVLERLTLPVSTPLILCCKGILSDGRLPSTVVPSEQPYAILSGPGFAGELAAGLPAAHVVAGNATLAEDLAQRLSTPNFRLYWSDDPVGVQVCGALKNVLAIAAGVADGLGLGESARAALITRGMREIRLGLEAMGGQEKTLWSLAGIGDLILTCSSPTSRNFRFGQQLAKGVPVSEALAAIGTVEGYHTLGGFLQTVPREEVPIAAALEGISKGDITPEEALHRLMTRPVTSA